MLCKRYSALLLLCICAVQISFAQLREITDSRNCDRACVLERALELEYRKDYKGAIALLKHALAEAQDDYKLHYELAVALIKGEDLARAQAHLISTIALMPNFAPPHNLLGRLVYKQNRTASFMALCFYNLLVPQSAEAHRNFCYLRELSGRSVAGEQHTGPQAVFSPEGTHRKRANDFSAVDVILNAENSMNQPISADDPDYFLMRFNWFCKSLQKNATDQSGFFWKFYVPYFVDIYNRGYARAAVWILLDRSPKNVELAREIQRFKAWNRRYILKRLYRF